MDPVDKVSMIAGAASDAMSKRRLATAAATAMSFCHLSETWPVFVEFFVENYKGEEDKEKIRKLTREDWSLTIAMVVAQLDPDGLELMLRQLDEEEADAANRE